MEGLFGCIVAGRYPITHFTPTSSTKCFVDIENPSNINEIAFFLFPSSPIPAGYGAVIYYAVTPYVNWTLLGSVHPEKPSGIFRTGWSSNDEIRGAVSIRLGISLETYDTLQNLTILNSGVDDRFAYAIKVAKDLFNFISSFSTSTTTSPNGDMMLVPTRVLDMWYERFNRKYSLDPGFLLKDSV